MGKEKGQTMMHKNEYKCQSLDDLYPKDMGKKYITNDSIMFLYYFAVHKWGLAFYSYLVNTYITASFH